MVDRGNSDEGGEGLEEERRHGYQFFVGLFKSTVSSLSVCLSLLFSIYQSSNILIHQSK